jgi:pyridoxine 4-dehydrogenase
MRRSCHLRVPPGHRTGPISEHFGALAELRDAGMIRHLGVSGITSCQLAGALAIAPVVCVQNAYGISVPDQDRALLRLCGELGLAFVPFHAIAGSGSEPGPAARDSQALRAIARAHDASAAQVRLAWTLQQGPHVLAIPGTGDPGHLAQNVAAGAIHLSEEEMTRLTSLRPAGT